MFLNTALNLIECSNVFQHLQSWQFCAVKVSKISKMAFSGFLERMQIFILFSEIANISCVWLSVYKAVLSRRISHCMKLPAMSVQRTNISHQDKIHIIFLLQIWPLVLSSSSSSLSTYMYVRACVHLGVTSLVTVIAVGFLRDVGAIILSPYSSA